jgi:hypothetical protein
VRLVAAALSVTLWATACAAPMKQTAEMQGGALAAALAASQPASLPSSAPSDPDDVVVELPPGKCLTDWQCWRLRATMLNQGYTARGGLLSILRERLTIAMNESAAGKLALASMQAGSDQMTKTLAENQALLEATPSAARWLVYGLLIGFGAAAAVFGGVAGYFALRSR